MHYLTYNHIKFDLVRFFCSLVREPELQKMKSAAVLFLPFTVWMKIFICSRSITHEKWLMHWRSLTIPLGRIWQDLHQLSQKATHNILRAQRQKPAAISVCEEPFNNMVMNNNLESRLVLKITTIFFLWKNENTLNLQEQKSALAEKEVCNNYEVQDSSYVQCK